MTADEARERDGALSIREVFRRIIAAAEGETVSVGRILEAFGTRAYGPILFVVGVFMVSPVGAIPGAPLTCVAVVTLLMGQSLVRRGPPWIPPRLARIEIDSARLRDALERTLPWFRRIEIVLRPRLTVLIRPPVSHLWAVTCILISLTMIPLGFVPFGAAIPALSIAIIGLGLMAADGVVVLAGAAVSGAAFWIGVATLRAAM